MLSFTKQRIWAFFSSILDFVKRHRTIFSLGGIAAFIGLMQSIGVWNPVLKWFGISISYIWQFSIQTWTAPIYAWFILSLLFILLIITSFRDHIYLGKVAGEFNEDFKNGLDKWEFKGEWRIEEDGRKKILSVANSGAGGFTKKGFNWTDYEFSFETKVIRSATGWIIRANDSSYFMVQLYLKGDKKYEYKLRPHYHQINGATEIWVPDDNNSLDLSSIELKKEIKLLQWIKVKIKVDGKQVDIFLDGKQAFHYLISSGGITIEKKLIIKNNQGEEFEATMKEIVPLGNNAAGRVGFRCGDGEHAHFKDVNVKPL